MIAQISSKLAAFTAALMISSFIMGGTAYLLEAHTQQAAPSIALDSAMPTSKSDAA
jgi:hypothetical protein